MNTYILILTLFTATDETYQKPTSLDMIHIEFNTLKACETAKSLWKRQQYSLPRNTGAANKHAFCINKG